MEIVQEFRAVAKKFLEEKKNYKDKTVDWMKDLKEMSFFLLNPKIKFSNKSSLLQKIKNLVPLVYSDLWEPERKKFQYDFVNNLLLVLNISPSEFKKLYDKARGNEKILLSQSFGTCISTFLTDSCLSRISNKETVKGRLVEALKLFDIRQPEFLLIYFDWKLSLVDGRLNSEKFLEKFRELVNLFFLNAKNFKFFRSASMHLDEFFNQEKNVSLLQNKLELMCEKPGQRNYHINEKGLDKDLSRLDNIVLFGKSENSDVVLSEKCASLTFILYFTDNYFIIPTHPKLSLWYQIQNNHVTQIEDGNKFMIQNYQLKVLINDSVNFVFKYQKRKFVYRHFIDWTSLNDTKCQPVCHDHILEISNSNFDQNILFIYNYNHSQKEFQYFLFCRVLNLYANYNNLKTRTLQPFSSSQIKLNSRLSDLCNAEYSPIPLFPDNLFTFTRENRLQQTKPLAISLLIQYPKSSEEFSIFEDKKNHESLFFKTPAYDSNLGK